MGKKQAYIILLVLFAAFTANAQLNSTMGAKKSSGFGMGGGKGSANKNSSSSSSKSKSSKSGSSSKTKKSNGPSSKSSSFSQKKSMSSSSGTTGSSSSGSISSGKASVGAAKAIVKGRSYPGIGKSKAIESLKGGTKYSYPGVHNVKWDIKALQKKSKSNQGIK